MTTEQTRPAPEVRDGRSGGIPPQGEDDVQQETVQMPALYHPSHSPTRWFRAHISCILCVSADPDRRLPGRPHPVAERTARDGASSSAR